MKITTGNRHLPNERLHSPDRRGRESRTGAVAAIPTAGEILGDGILELVAGPTDAWQLMLLSGERTTMGQTIEHAGRCYKPIELPPDFFRELILPACCRPHGTTRQLLTDVCTAAAKYAGLQEKLASLAARFVLTSWIVDNLDIAPALGITGPDEARAERLLSLLHCLCRHGIRLAGLTPSSLCSLPSGFAFTLLVSQATISDKLNQRLWEMRHREARIPFRGRLLNLYGTQAIYSGAVIGAGFRSTIRIPTMPGSDRLPIFDAEIRRRLAMDFQPRLLSFRRADVVRAGKLDFDGSKFDPAVRELAYSIAAATPDDRRLQSEVFELLRNENDSARDQRWTAFEVVATEAVIAAYLSDPGKFVYIADLAKIAEEILQRRGESRDARVDPGRLSKWLRANDIWPEPRVAKGSKLHVTEAVFQKAQKLAIAFGAPAAEPSAAPEGSSESCRSV